jgi:putative ABC transport system permease protein
LVGSRLFRTGWRHLIRHGWQSGLSVLGIMLGVAVVTAVDLANDSARRAFELSMDQVTGGATHQIVGGPTGIPDHLHTSLRVRQGLRPSAPVVEGLVRLRGETFTLLGLDPFSEKGFRPVLEADGGGGIGTLLTRGDALAMPAVSARRLGLKQGDRIQIEVAGRASEVEVAMLIGGRDESALDGLLFSDISTAQELLDRVGRLDRIDLILDPAAAAHWSERLPEGVRLVSSGDRTAAMARMSEAFQINLGAMSLLALLVGAFLIYNAMTFSVLQRRGLLGMLRVMGVTRRELFGLVLLEAVVVGALGTLLGLALGILLAQGLVTLVARTINDLYFTLTVSQLSITGSGLLKATLLGMAATLAATLAPAIEAARSSPLAVTRRSHIELHAHRTLPWLTSAGLVSMILGLLVVRLPGENLGLGFSGLFLIILGYALVVPLVVVLLSRLLLPLLKRLSGSVGRLAGRGIDASLSRTGLAVAALTLAVAATVGMGIMVSSFRATVEDWLAQTLRGDIYVSIPQRVSSRASTPLPEGLPQRLLQLPGIRELSLGRGVQVDTGGGPVDLLSIEMASASYEGFRFKGPTLPEVWQRFDAGEVIIASEPFAYHRSLETGDRVSLLTARGVRQFTVGGIFFDYGSDRGMLVVTSRVYQALWEDDAVSTIGIYLEEDAGIDAVMTRVRQSVGSLDDRIRVTANREIFARSMEVFDRTFTITNVLRLLVIGVAFVGILSALMALMLEWRREHAILRATGLLPGQLLGLVLLQTGVMGLMAGLLSLPLGWFMAEVLIDVINKRAFGWSIQQFLPTVVLAEALLFSLAAALLAGLYPALRLMRTAPVAALREE